MPLPFEEEEQQVERKTGLKPMAQKSMFDKSNKPRRQTQQEFQQKVQDSQEKLSGYKARAAELNSNFYKVMADKTLAQNKSPFQNEIEHELMTNLISLANEINNDEDEGEGIGTLTILVPIMKICFFQRNRINELEYSLAELQKKVNPAYVSDLVKKEIASALDKKKGSE